MSNPPDPILQIPYTLTLTVPGSSPSSVSYTIDLTNESDENNPLPRLQKEADNIQNSFQEKGFQRIRRSDFQEILKEWAKEIMVGYQDVHISKALAPVELDILDSIQDMGCSALPAFMPPSLNGVEPELTLLPSLNV